MKYGIVLKVGAMAIMSFGLYCGNVFGADTQMTNTTSTNGAEAGQSFLQTNKNKPGVVTLPDGLQYKVIKEGNGATPTANDTVEVNYAGRLVDGTEFDSSYKRGESISFPVNGVIAGWTEALKLMKV